MARVASLSLLPNATSSLALALTSCSCIKGRIVLALKRKKKEKRKKRKKEGVKGGQDNKVHLSFYLILQVGRIAGFTFSAR